VPLRRSSQQREEWRPFMNAVAIDGNDEELGAGDLETDL
jgi:hypothetical protein